MNQSTPINTTNNNINNNNTLHNNNTNNFQPINNGNFTAPPHHLSTIPLQSANPAYNPQMTNGASMNNGPVLVGNQNDYYPTSLTSAQIENLQNLIRQFKALGKRFSESAIPKLIETYAQNHLGGTAALDFQKLDAKPLPDHKPMMNPVPAPVPIPVPIPAPMPQMVPVPQSLPHHPLPSAHHPLPQQPQQQPIHPPQPTQKDTAPIPQATLQNAVHSLNNINPLQPQSQPSGPSTSGTVAPLSNPVTTNLPTLSLSWQCFHSLLLYGTSKNMGENAISFPPSDVGCFSKGAYLPLVLTIPGVTTIREELIKSTLIMLTQRSRELGQNRLQTQCFFLQRHVRANVLKVLMESRAKEFTAESNSGTNNLSNFKLTAGIPLGTSNYFADIVPASSCFRIRKQSKREIKAWEKDDKKKRVEIEEKKKRKVNDYHKALMEHRDAFQKFHKGNRTECARVAKLVRISVENMDQKRERDEARAEMKRLQALKENDMEAYTSLVQETKNGRLKYLLNETDNYIATINRMIQEQRTPDGAEVEVKDENKVDTIADLLVPKSSAAVKDYYTSTHRRVEIVSQPRMLKGGDLKEYQLSGLQWLVSLYNNNLNGILADEMGLGKTIQTIALISYLMEYKHNNGPFLIVVPLSTLSNWVNEFNKWAPDIIKVVYKGTPDERKRIFKDEIESHLLNVLITTYEYIMKDKSSLKKLTWQYIIVDEGHRMKNAQSKFAQTLGTIYTSKHRILLTGTPLQNNLPELWALLNFLLPTIFSSVDTFDQWFNKPFAQFRNQANAAAAAAVAEEGNNEVNVLTQEERMLIVHRLHEVLRPFVLRRVKDQVLDQLPEKVEKILRCSLSGWQRKMYHSITVRTLANKAKDSAVGGLNNTIMQLRKVCNHPYLFMKNYIVDEDIMRISGKFELLDRMLPKLKAAGHRVLIFSQMVEVMNFLEEFFNYRGFYFLRLDGNTTSEDREKRMYMFNDPNSPYFIFLLSTKAGGLGLNLATADTVIIFDSDWNPMVDAQAQDRAHRIGQKNEVRVFRLLTNSAIEEKILARATDKLNLTGLVVEAGKFNSKNENSMEENKEMMESLLKEYASGGAEMSGYGDTEQYENNDFDNKVDDDIPDDEQINEMMAAYEGEYELYQRMDLESYNKEKLLGRESRLMKATEKPNWLTNDCWPTKYSILMTDMMTSDPLQTLTKQVNTGPKKKGRKRKIIEPQASQDYDGNERPDSPSFNEWNENDMMMNLNPNETLIGGKVMRKRKDVKYDDGMTDFQFKKYLEKQATNEEYNPTDSVGKKGRGKRGTAHLNIILQGLIKIIQEIQKIKKLDGTLIAELFLEKPPKSYYPDYYQLIENPISLKEILMKIRNEEYNYFEEIELDFAIMSNNARIYNGELSPVFAAAENVRREFYMKSNELRIQLNILSLSDPILNQPNGGDIPSLPPGNSYQIFPKSKNYLGELTLPDATNSSATKPKKRMKTSHTPNSTKAQHISFQSPLSSYPSNGSFNNTNNDDDDEDGGNGGDSDSEGVIYEDDENEGSQQGRGGLVLNFGGLKSSAKKK